MYPIIYCVLIFVVFFIFCLVGEIWKSFRPEDFRLEGKDSCYLLIFVCSIFWPMFFIGFAAFGILFLISLAAKKVAKKITRKIS
jgi:hypothetical protein